jgi:Transposase, Mutator family
VCRGFVASADNLLTAPGVARPSRVWLRWVSVSSRSNHRPGRRSRRNAATGIRWVLRAVDRFGSASSWACGRTRSGAADRGARASRSCRNLLAKVSAHDQDEVKAAFCAIFDVGDAEPGDAAVAVATRRAAEFAAKWKSRYPAAVACVTDDLASLTVHLRFPAEHWRRIRHSNFIERTFGETRRRVKVIGRLSGETSCLSLVWAVLDRASRGWRGLTMTPKALRLLQDLRRQLLHPSANETIHEAVTAAAQHHSGACAPSRLHRSWDATLRVQIRHTSRLPAGDRLRACRLRRRVRQPGGLDCTRPRLITLTAAAECHPSCPPRPGTPTSVVTAPFRGVARAGTRCCTRPLTQSPVAANNAGAMLDVSTLDAPTQVPLQLSCGSVHRRTDVVPPRGPRLRSQRREEREPVPTLLMCVGRMVDDKELIASVVDGELGEVQLHRADLGVLDADGPAPGPPHVVAGPCLPERIARQ